MSNILKSITLDGVTKEVESGGGGGGLEHLFDATADGSLRGNTAAAEVSGTYEVGESAIAIGKNAKASGKNSSAFGSGVEASGLNSHAEGGSTTASGKWSHAEGRSTKAQDDASHAEGAYSYATGYVSHAEGFQTKATGSCAHSEGGSTQATGQQAHAEGTGTIASGDESHAEGGATVAEGKWSHAEGRSTKASGETSHAEGHQTVASGETSHAEGDGTTASGKYSHAGGCRTIAQRRGQTVIGEYNIADTGGTDETTRGNYVFIIGNGFGGIDPVSSNALTADWNGNLWIAGALTQGSDKRLKEHIGYLGDDAVEFVRKLKPAHYTKDNASHVGFYAQDVEEEDKWECMVGLDAMGYKTLGYTELIAPLVAYCQHLEKRIEELEKKGE